MALPIECHPTCASPGSASARVRGRRRPRRRAALGRAAAAAAIRRGREPAGGQPRGDSGRHSGLFDGFCADCHGGGGVGNNKGPALNTGTFKHGGDDAGLFRTIKNGIPGTEMDANANVPDNQIWQLVAYIRSLAPVTADRGPAASASAVGGNAAAGEAIFFGKGACATCHDINGRGGAVGSDLSAAGQLPVATLRQAILDPNALAPAAGGQRGGGRGGGRGGPRASRHRRRHSTATAARCAASAAARTRSRCSSSTRPGVSTPSTR